MDQRKEINDQEKPLPKEDNGQTRRSALKKIVMGGGFAASAAVLPSKWTKPIMNRVLIPAHAQTSPPGGGDEQFEGGRDDKVRIYGQSPGKIDIIATIIGLDAYIQFQSQWYWRENPKKGFSAWPANGTTPAPPTTCSPDAPGLHYEYEALAPLPTGNTAKAGKKVDVKFIQKFSDCTDEGNKHGKIRVLEYAKGDKLVVEIWGKNNVYPLTPKTPVSLQGLTKCCVNDEV